ncbi:MAG: nuclear transport factor 2 family protein [Pirellulales bacterium]|nr:nuclear transport factor 2 family protein [Pirellulales bacterium]
MRHATIPFVAAALSAFLAADRACGQGGCRNGTCPTGAIVPAVPVEASVSLQQDLGPLEKKIVEMEKAALEKWYAGDPSAYIAMIDDDIGYFEPILDKRLDGREPLRKIYEALRGKVRAEKFDMLNTRVQATDNMAVLSFNLISIEGGVPFRWNCTEVFSPDKSGQWKLVHSHWSQTKPPQCGR